MSILRIIFHALTVIQYMGATYYNANYVVVPNTEEFKGFHGFGGRAKYLTLWNMIIQAVFFWICLINDFFGTNEFVTKDLPLIRRVKDVMFCSVAFPLSAFVAVTFWGLYAIDRELVLPQALDAYFPTWLNHIMHTNIIIFTVLEMVTSFRVYPARKIGISCLMTVMICYLIWILIIYAKSGNWVYPVMEVLNWPQKILFFGSLLLLSVGFYFMGEGLNKLFWSKELKFVMCGKRVEKKKGF